MNDEYYMRIALDLAITAEGQTSPNPLVGAVCVKDGQIIGTGAHLKAGTPHAEVHAITMAHDHAKGADLYVTLEPCGHRGKTPPCTNLIINSGIRRVVIACMDPNPLVKGRGISQLKQAGIEVVTGVLEKEAAFLNRAFFHYIQYGTPYVTLKAAATLDGRIAASSGDSKWITSKEAREDVHYLRHIHDAILVGAQTVIADNPFLTTRLPHGGKNPIRIVLDRRLQTPNTANVVTDEAVKTIIFTQVPLEEQNKKYDSNFVHKEVIPKSQAFLPSVLKYLGGIGVMTLLVEGGSRVHSSFIDENLADELYLYLAPKLIGNGTSFFSSEKRNWMKDSENLYILDMQTFGLDLRLHAQFQKEESASCLLE
ncbi:bifunctional diaminohydroxyphosphoribosylaminopyrimidine deaminase/5-amino-6-(5-phosphoribosylamino)uracil reductase RibD [Bacillus mesophilum]|uniref:Riboflavin biosynthesis protein RibD n=1 Tax=Bacillus mesophilum TaxID=1071718 RepID=A0A7V7UVR4_9BACI|nr:bifunctional diaminohydroxyphosphoribosylaminopyrimidine deaminase/5-amino-6-(5-phosphoribosylamino)uracil reductase RibD [Bacillus mesophilum]KAB2333006.1 bifunctional diaminohydroxyphosphoribosylaminopyrimidine deaminase/5-amino-6-(5-phosphoribosylamino)uracil reductase RibD [Bacillus mesophilum]